MKKYSYFCLKIIQFNDLGAEILDHLSKNVMIPMRLRPTQLVRLKQKSAKLKMLWHTFFHKICFTYNTLFSFTCLI